MREIPTHEAKEDVQRLRGMIKFVQMFAPQLFKIRAQLRGLMKFETHFRWDEYVHWKVFTDVKTVLSNTPVLRVFDKDISLIFSVTQSGLGACLIQEGHPIMYASISHGYRMI